MMQPQNWIAVFAAVGLGILSYTVFQPSAFPRLVTLKEQKRHLQHQVSELKSQVSLYQEELTLLSFRSDFSLSHLEKIAREEFGLVYPAETVVFVGLVNSNQGKQ